MFLNYEEFKEEVTKGLRNRLPGDYQVKTGSVTKINGQELESVAVAKVDAEFYPIHYFQQLFKAYSEGINLETILDIILEQGQMEEYKVPGIFTAMENYEAVEKHIYCKVINQEKNAEMLKDVPHIKFKDLAVVFYVMIDCEDDGMQAMINNNLMELWEKDKNDLKRISAENTRRDNGPVVLGVRDFLMNNLELLESEDIPEGGEEMLSVGGYLGKNGAIYMLDHNIMGEIADCFHDDLYIIPSSVHEVITIPAGLSDRESLDEIIRSVNETTVLPGEYLSDHAYYFSREERRIV